MTNNLDSMFCFPCLECFKNTAPWCFRVLASGHGVLKAETCPAIRGRRKPAEAEVLPSQTSGHGAEFSMWQEAPKPPAPGLWAGERRSAQATAGERGGCAAEGPAREHGPAHRSQQSSQTRPDG